MDTEFDSLHYPLLVDHALGRIQQETDFSRHVEQLVMQVLMSAPGERINRPDFGCGVKRLVFAPGGDVAATLAQATVYQALNRWLSNVINVSEVAVTSHDSTLHIRIGYVIKARGERHYLNLEVTP